MTNEQIHLVKASFERILPEAEAVAGLFYERLFELDPNLLPLFKGEMKEQGRKLMQMIGLAVKSLDRIDELIPAVQSLGARHAGYGIKNQHYETVAAALLWTLEKGLGADFTERTKEAWVTVYTLLANIMQQGARQAEEDLPIAA